MSPKTKGWSLWEFCCLHGRTPQEKGQNQVKLSKWWQLPSSAGILQGPSAPPDLPLLSFPQGKRYKTSLETVGTPDSSRGRSEKKTIK